LQQIGFYGSNGFQSRPGDETGLNSSVLLDLAPYSPVEVRIRFAGTYRIHLQVRRLNQISCLLLGVYFLSLLFYYEGSGSTFIRNVSDYRTKRCHVPVCYLSVVYVTCLLCPCCTTATRLKPNCSQINNNKKNIAFPTFIVALSEMV
jgi:hypothetical protein